eukprot:6828395-Pyramimonas_sp.AAC.1
MSVQGKNQLIPGAGMVVGGCDLSMRIEALLALWPPGPCVHHREPHPLRSAQGNLNPYHETLDPGTPNLGHPSNPVTPRNRNPQDPVTPRIRYPQDLRPPGV